MSSSNEEVEKESEKYGRPNSMSSKTKDLSKYSKDIKKNNSLENSPILKE